MQPPASTAQQQVRVFLNYRRAETSYAAGWLFARFEERIGRSCIFKDVDSVPLGADFVDVITHAVTSCNVFLALIGDQWLSITDAHENRRLDDPADFVRVEIEIALARGLRVIPVLVEHADMPSPDELPPSLRPLTRRNAFELSSNHFDTDLQRLFRALGIEPGKTDPNPLRVSRPDFSFASPKLQPATVPQHRLHFPWTIRFALAALVLIAFGYIGSGIDNLVTNHPLDPYILCQLLVGGAALISAVGIWNRLTSAWIFALIVFPFSFALNIYDYNYQHGRDDPGFYWFMGGVCTLAWVSLCMPTTRRFFEAARASRDRLTVS
jgi:hypothetical protein